MSVPRTTTRKRASQAYDAHCALLKAEALTPALRDNPYWTMLRQDAFERFAIELEADK